MDSQDQFDQKIYSVEDIKLAPDASILIIGKRRIGKSVLAVNLIKCMTDQFNFNLIILFSDTKDVENNGSYEFVDKKFSYLSKDMDEKISKLIDFQIEQKKRYGKCQYVLLILDDINLEKKSKQLNRLYQIARHINICIITIVQFGKHVISNIIKSNTDIIIFSKQNNNGLEAIFECINSQLNKQQFYKFVREKTIDHQFLMYNLLEDDDKLKIIKAQFIKVKGIKQ